MVAVRRVTLAPAGVDLAGLNLRQRAVLARDLRRCRGCTVGGARWADLAAAAVEAHMRAELRQIEAEYWRARAARAARYERFVGGGLVAAERWANGGGVS